MSDRVGVLFVCLGNICRSPLAEGVFRQLVEHEGLAEDFDIDSAGTSSYHTGDSPDERTVAVAARRGLRLEHVARQIQPADLRRFEYVIAMDNANLSKVQRLAAQTPDAVAEVHLLRAFEDGADAGGEVPDPYFGGAGGFEEVHDMVVRSCRGLLEHIRRAHDL